jgi:hypothetical protein
MVYPAPRLVEATRSELLILYCNKNAKLWFSRINGRSLYAVSSMICIDLAISSSVKGMLRGEMKHQKRNQANSN